MNKLSLQSTISRSALRSTSPWRYSDVAVALIACFVLYTAIFRPAALADLGDAVIGSTTLVEYPGFSWLNQLSITLDDTFNKSFMNLLFDQSQGKEMVPVTWSSIIMTIVRWLGITTGFYVITNVRSVPLTQRIIVLLFITSMCMNYARNLYLGSPATMSIVLGLIAIASWHFNLMNRPSVWEDRDQYKQDAQYWRNEAEREDK